MNTRNQDIQDQIMVAALEDVTFDGWQWSVIEAAAERIGADDGWGEDMAFAVFPNKMEDVMAFFSEWADRQMLVALENENLEELPVRERIKRAVWARFEVLEPHKEAVRAATSYWLVPTRKAQAAKLVWKSADVIWDWAGDTADDYNHYTKRLLLGGVMTSTSVAWLNDKSEDHAESYAFLERRIGNVLKIGGATGKILGPILSRLGNLKKKATAS